MKYALQTLLMMALSCSFVAYANAQSSETDILTFVIPEQIRDADFWTDSHYIQAEVAQGTDPSSLTPTWTLSDGATSDPVSGTTGDYSSDFTILVTAEDGTVQPWTINVRVASTNHENDLLSFTPPNQVGSEVIDNVNHTVTAVVTDGTDLNTLAPTWTLSAGATSDPVSGTSGSYSDAYIITVRAENTFEQDWEVYVYEESEVPSNETDILSFSMTEQVQSATIDAAAHTVWIELLFGTDPTNLYASWTVSQGATSDPVSGSSNDYSSPLVIAVTAEDGVTTQNWTVTAEVEATPNTDILTFSLPEQIREPDIDSRLHVLYALVPEGQSLDALTAEWTLSEGATSDPVSGTERDYNDADTITVTADDGVTTQDWVVNVTNTVGNHENDILTFAVTEQTGPATIDSENHTILCEVAADTDLSSLQPTWTLSANASSNPLSGSSGDYSDVFTIIVTAENGFQQNWTVRVYDEEDARTDETEIESFTVAEQVQPATIDGTNHSIWVELLFGTDDSAINPTWTLSEGATSVPMSGSEGDYSEPYTITVTAEDGLTTQDWTVTTEVEATPHTDILTFYVPEQIEEPDIDPVNHHVEVLVSQATSRTSLSPEWTLSEGATSVPVSGTEGDYSTVVTIAVTAEDGYTTQDWTVEVTNETSNHETDILSFEVAEQTQPAVIDSESHTILCPVATGTDLRVLSPTWSLSPEATSDPASGSSDDYTEVFTIQVTAGNGFQQDWKVLVYDESEVPSSETDIVRFSSNVQVQPATIDADAHTVWIELLFGTDASDAQASWDVSEGATSDPESGNVADFSTPVVITVTAENGITTQDWTVTTEVEATPNTDILTFYLPEQIQEPDISSLGHTVDVLVSQNQNLDNLTPEWTLSPGATSDPESGTEGDYSEPDTITVTADNGYTSQDWIVDVIHTSGNHENDILTFAMQEQTAPAVINTENHTVLIEVADGSPLPSLRGYWTLSEGAGSTPESGISGNYTDVFVIEVQAQNGFRQDWQVRAYEEDASLSEETDILSFTMSGQTGPPVIDDSEHTVRVEVVEGTFIESTAPTWTLSDGATSTPPSGTNGDYSEPVTITVFAEDLRITQDWTVYVSEAPSQQTDILTFSVPEETTPATIDALAHTVAVEVASGTDLATLVPTWTLSEGAISDPESGMEGDYSSAFTIQVIAEDTAVTQDWIVNVTTAASSANDILSFIVPEQNSQTIIDAEQHSILLRVEEGTDLTNLTPTWVVSEGATSSPESGTTGDYGDLVFITVTAENGTEQDWRVRVIEDGSIFNDDTDILSFTVAEETGPAVIDANNHSVHVEVAYGTDLTELAPIWTLSESATSAPESGTLGDYSAPYAITVYAELVYISETWTVYVTEAPSNETDILSFSIAQETGPATINTTDHTVSVEVAFGTVLTTLAPEWTVSDGASSDPESGTTGDYSVPFDIEVTAEDGTTIENWTVNVSEAPNSANDILTFAVAEQTKEPAISTEYHSVLVEVAEGTNLAALAPDWTLSEEATSVPVSGTVGDYSDLFVIDVTAGSGASQEWKVRVIEDGSIISNDADILTFTVPEETGPAVIDKENRTVSVEVVYGTDLGTITPTWTLSEGATSDPESGTTDDYSSAYSIIVTAENVSVSEQWTVHVSEAPNDETDILTFSILEETGPATINTVDHTVSIEVAHGTNLGGLVPAWTLSDGATSGPESGTEGDYSIPYVIEVTAEDETTIQGWTINVSEAPSSETDILTFSIPEETAPATINTSDHTVAVEVAYGTALTNLTPVWTLSEGASSDPMSETTADYSAPYNIEVTAEDGTTIENWTVNVTVGPNTANDILTFTVTGQTGPSSIDAENHTVLVEVASGTVLTSIAPEWTLSTGASSSPVSGTSDDYSEVVSIIVVAESGADQRWRVLVFEEGSTYNEETDILTFTLPQQTGPAVISTDDHTVTIEVANGTDLAGLTPTWTLSAGATSEPASGTTDDYSAPYTIIVYAENVSISQNWTINVSEEPNVETDIVSFGLPEETGPATIDASDHTVAIEVVYGTDVASLTPSWTLSEGATSNPLSDTEGDYSGAFEIDVTAEDGATTQKWTVNVSEEPNDETDILSFSIPEQADWASINTSENTVTVEVVYGTNLMSLSPTWTLSDGASSDPVSGTSGDYSDPVSIEVTAEDGATVENWTVTVTEATNTATDIESFSIPEETESATINTGEHTVSVEVTYGTDLSSLTPTWTLSAGAASNPESGTTSDYSTPVTIEVTAEDGTTNQDWTVNVSEAPNDSTDILSFSIPEQTAPAAINTSEHTVSIEVGHGTNLTSLLPTWTLSTGAASDPESGTAGDYSDPVTIEVTAQDGTTKQNWIVTVNEEPNDETDILTFAVANQTGSATINGDAHSVTVEVSPGTDLTSLAPTWTLSEGATSAPVSGTSGDYSSPVTIVVTAQDGVAVQNWTVTVNEAPSTGTDILTFTVAEEIVPGTIDNEAHTVTVDVYLGSDMERLTPTWTLSEGATSDPVSGTTGDYSSPVTIVVTAENGEEQEWLITIAESIITGLEDQAKITKEISVFPVPTADFVSIRTEVPFTRVVVFDLAGNRVKEISEKNISKVDCSGLIPGVYLLAFFDQHVHRGNVRIVKR